MTSDADMRRAIHDVFEYAKAFNTVVDGLGQFKPFGDLRGFKGRGVNLDKKTTRLILKGIGLKVS